MRKSVLFAALAGIVVASVAVPALAKTMHHMMMHPTAEYGAGFLGFSTKASDCTDLMVMAARSDSHDDRYYTKQYIACMAK